MRCSRVQADISASMDGEWGALSEAALEHASTCPRCITFAEGARAVRTAVRVQAAPAVPDLVGGIMARVARDETVVGSPALRRRRPIDVRAVVAAGVVGLLVGVGLVWGGVVPRTGQPASAESVPRHIQAAAAGVASYQASYTVEERNFSAASPVRRFQVNVAFLSPERFRVDVSEDSADSVVDPIASTLVVDGSKWSLTGPRACISAVTSPCPVSASRIARTVTDRPPFDGDTPMPTDIILPLSAMSAAGDVRALGTRNIEGREAVGASLSAGAAGPLFAFFQQAGSWRSLYPGDEVQLWLDARTWFPLGYSVTAAAGPQRAAWAARNGYGSESAGDLLYQVALTSLQASPPSRNVFATQDAGSATSSQGFRDIPVANLAPRLGSLVQPSDLEGLRPYRSGTFSGSNEVLLSYARGLAWLKIREAPAGSTGEPFGLSGPVQPIILPNGGTAYLSPASGGFANRIAVHSANVDLLLESNLSREKLVRIAASLPVQGLPVSVESGASGVPVAQLAARAGFTPILPPSSWAGGAIVSSQVLTFDGQRSIHVVFGPASGSTIELYESPGATIPPATGADQVVVNLVGGVLARWTPDTSTLEWVEAGTYVSLTAPGRGLDELAALASQMSGSP
jgi:outer membrane lipoprotein-sorting protein